MHTTITKACMIAVALSLTSLAAAIADDARSATVRMSGGSTGLVIGGNWGEGTLSFEGHEYPFTIGGLTIGDLGVNGFTASGVVNNLTRAENFNGNYIALDAGLTIAGGGAAFTMRNQDGVTIHMVSTTRGLKLALGGGGIHLEIPESGFATVRAEIAAESAAARADDAARRIEAAGNRVEQAAERAERNADEAQRRRPGRRAQGMARQG